MKRVNLRELYPDTYKTDTYVEVTDEVLATIKEQNRLEANQQRTIRRYKAYHSLDSENSIERLFCSTPQSPNELPERSKDLRRTLRHTSKTMLWSYDSPAVDDLLYSYRQGCVTNMTRKTIQQKMRASCG